MFERFTEDARKAIFNARVLANQLGNPEIEPEHLLLGILRVDEPLVQRVLRTPAASPLLRKQIEEHCRAKATQAPSTQSRHLPLTAASRRALAYAEAQSQKLLNQEVDTRHLLMGIFRDESSFAAASLRAHRVTLEALEAETEPAVSPSSRDFQPMRDLTAAAAEGQLAPLIGRERELDRMLHILTRRTKNNALLVGEPGVGKTALLEGLATRIASGTQTAFYRRVVSMDAVSLAGVFALRQARRLEGQKDAILCVEGLLDWDVPAAFPLLEPGLAASEFQCIATGTPAGFRRFVKAFGGMARRFELVELAPATPDDSIAILQGLKERYEKFHGVTFTDDAIPAAVYISGRTLPQRLLPDRALDLLDDAGARGKLRGQPTVTAAQIAEAAAERAGVPLAALDTALDVRKPVEVELVGRQLAARLPPDQHGWLPLLAAYLAGCSDAAAEELAQAIREARSHL